MFAVPPALCLLVVIGMADLLATAVLQARGSIIERNPLMAPLLANGVAPFVAVKLATLAIAGALLMRQARRDREVVRRACLLGSGLYAASLAVGFFWS